MHKKLNKEMKYAGAWFTVLFLPQLFLLINFMGEAYPNQFHEKKNGGEKLLGNKHSCKHEIYISING